MHKILKVFLLNQKYVLLLHSDFKKIFLEA